MKQDELKLMHREEKQKIHDGIQEQIRVFDSKASTFLATVGIMFSITTSLFGLLLKEEFSTLHWSYKMIFIILLALLMVTTGIIFYFSANVIVPREGKKTSNNDKDKKEELHPTFYKDVTKMTKESFRENVYKHVLDDTLLVNQILSIADICDKKSKNLRIAFKYFRVFIALLFLIVLFIIIIKFIWVFKINFT